MKQIYSLILPALMLASAPMLEAGTPAKAQRHEVAKAGKVSRAKVKDYFKSEVAGKSKKAVAKASSADAILTGVSGVKKNYISSNTSFYSFWGYSWEFDDAGLASEFVYNESNGAVYMKDPITYLPYGTYIEGSYTDTSLSFSFPQALLEEEGEVYYAHRMVIDSANSDEWDSEYVVDDSKPVTFTIAADGTISCDEQNGDVIIGLTDADGEWMQYGNYNMVYKPFDKQLLTISSMPADFASHLEDWMIIGDDNASQSVQVANYDGKIYIAGLDEDNEESLIVGTIDGDFVKFESEQYTGIDEDYNYYKLFYGLSVTQEYDDYFEEYYSTYTTDSYATFIYDAENGELSCENDGFGLVGGDVSDPNEYAVFTNATIQRVPDGISYQPKAAYDLALDVDGDSYLTFSWDAVNVDGWPLNTNNLYFRIYFNDKVFTFTTDYYEDGADDLTDIGFNQELYDADGYADVYTGDDDYSRYVYFYYEVENPGIQTVYKDGDKEYCSEIVYVESASVSNTIADKLASSVSYTDLAGRTVAQPSTGIYLRTVRYADGSTKTAKVFVK